MADPRVSVIIPVLDDAEGLTRCLDALARQTFKGFEVIVVDNGSATDLQAVVAAHALGARFLREPKRGSYVARNRGIAAARGQVLAFTDGDCVPRPDWLEAGVAALDADPATGLVGGRIQVTVGDPAHRRPAETYELAFGFPQEHYVRDLGFAATANLFTRRAVVDAIGPFHPDLQSSGDYEWGQRVRRSYKVRYTAEAVVEHPARASLAELAKKQRRLELGRAVLGLSQPAAWPAWRFGVWCVAQAVPPVNLVPGLVRKGRGFGWRAPVDLFAMRYGLNLAGISAVRAARRARHRAQQTN